MPVFEECLETLKIKQFRLKKRRITRLLTGTETGVQFQTWISKKKEIMKNSETKILKLVKKYKG